MTSVEIVLELMLGCASLLQGSHTVANIRLSVMNPQIANLAGQTEKSEYH